MDFRGKGLVKKLSKLFALGKEEKRRQSDDRKDRGCSDAARLQQDIVEGDVDHDGPEHQQAEIPRLGNDKEDAADDLQRFHDRKQLALEHSLHILCRQTPWLGFRCRHELKEKVRSEDDEEKAEENGGDKSEFFHDLQNVCELVLVEVKKQKFRIIRCRDLQVFGDALDSEPIGSRQIFLCHC